jgi:hypothetical protein
MGNQVPFRSIDINNTETDYNTGTKREVVLKNGCWSDRFYKLNDASSKWILINEEIGKFNIHDENASITISSNNIKTLFDTKKDLTFVDENGPELDIKKEDIPKDIDTLYTAVKNYNFDYQKIDLVKKYQSHIDCVPLDFVYNLANTFNSDKSKVKLYENVLKCVNKVCKK